MMQGDAFSSASSLTSYGVEAKAPEGVVLAAPVIHRQFSFVVPGVPTPWARAGGGKTVVRFTPARQRNAMGALKMICQAAMRGAKPIAGPVRIEVQAIYPWPASWPAKKRARPGAKWKTSRPDIDNVCLKIVADALNGVAWIDDAQIAAAHCWKLYGDLPGLAVTIEELA